MRPALRHALQAALALSLVALMATGLLAGIEALTRDRIAAAEREAELAALAAVLPASGFDNDPLADAIVVVAPGWLGTDAAQTVWRGRRDGAPSQLVLQAQAPRGYGGPIGLLVGTDAQAVVSGVRVTFHRETPGLGDPIEARRSDWMDGFRGRSLADPVPAGWRVRRDGGEFDQFTGATITPRAVVAAVARTLAFVEAHGDAVFDAPAGARLRFDDAPTDAPWTAR